MARDLTREGRAPERSEERSRLGRYVAVAVRWRCCAEEHHASTRERQRRKRAKERGKAPDGVLVSEANEGSSERASDGGF